MTDVKDSAARFVRAFNAHDEKAIRSHFDPTGTFEAPGGLKLSGTEAGTYAMGWIKACPDAKLSVRNELVSGPWVVDELKFEGTHQGPLASPVGTIAPTGRKLVTSSVLIIRYANDVAIETRLCFDQADVLSQLGALPMPVTAGV